MISVYEKWILYWNVDPEYEGIENIISKEVTARIILSSYVFLTSKNLHRQEKQVQTSFGLLKIILEDLKQDLLVHLLKLTRYSLLIDIELEIGVILIW